MVRTFTRASVALLTICAALGVTLQAQRRDDKKPADSSLNQAQRLELSPLFRLVDEVMKGTAAGTYLNFADSYKHNVAAYRLDKLLGIGMVPASVERKVGSKISSVTWWVDDVLMTEKQRYLKKIAPPSGGPWNRQIYCVRAFDELIYNFDRNLGNLVITKDWRIWMIDHTRSFLPYREPKNEKRLLQCDRHLLEAMRALTLNGTRKTLQPYLDTLRIEAMLSRRDRIVEYFEKEIAQRGEENVLFAVLPLETAVSVQGAGT